MSKTIKIIELLNKIANGELKMGTKIVYKYMTFIYDYPNVEGIYLSGCKRSKENNIFSYINTQDIKFSTVEIIEEQEEIDIQSIEMLDNTVYEHGNMTKVEIDNYHNYTRTILKHLILVVKQLDKKIKEN